MPALKGKTLLNQYRVDEFVASTPLGDLYRAADLRSEKIYALTELPKATREDGDALKELEAHSAALRAISHPNLIPYAGLRKTPETAFLLEEWIDGPSLRDVLALKTPLSPTEALTFVRAVCAGLETLHKNGFLHLHLAPELIRVDRQGEIRLGGIGAAQRAGAPLRKTGKYPRWYAAPETFSAQPPTSAADIYSLAVVLYQMVAAAWINSKDAPTTKDAIRKFHLEGIPPAPKSLNGELPDHFSRMTLWALRKNPEERFKTTTELLSALSLAAKIPLEALPRHVPRETDRTGGAFLTTKILDERRYLPPPKPALTTREAPPLQERLAALDSARPKKRTRAALLPILPFLLLAGFASLLFFIRPAPQPETPAAPTETALFAPPIPPWTETLAAAPAPRPTDEHGGRIVFTCTRGDYNQLCMIHRDGSGLVQLTDIEASNYYPVFTRDGGGVLFASNRNGTFDLYLLSFTQKDILQLTREVGNVVSPDYSPDGRQMVFVNRVGEAPASIWIANADGSNPRQLYAGKGNIVAAAWSPLGDVIAYAMSVGLPQEYEIFTMDVNGRNHTRLTQNLAGIGGSLSWSPDGTHLLIHAGRYEDKNIFKLDARTGKTVQITFGGNNAGAAYSPDGRYIVFNSLRNGGQADLYIMRADGSNQTQLTNDPEPDWGADWIE